VNAAEMMMAEYAFGAAGQEIVIEEFLEGEELSYFALCDGTTVLPLAAAQDHKRAYDGDTGPNTGGMGAYSPVPFVTPALEEKILRTCLQPVIDEMSAAGCPFTGVLFAGIMLKNGEPKILEYNVRFGDPECQILMSRMQGDLVDLLYAAAKGELDKVKDKISWLPEAALTVVMAAEGYPEVYQKDTEIKDIDLAEMVGGVKVFHAGTAEKDGKLVNTGGRVLNVTACGADLKDARDKAYAACDKIDWPHGFYRSDIGKRAV
jgi:phosphoribosylamine--glycine ligase